MGQPGLTCITSPPISPLGTDRFGQTGTLQDLYAEYRIGPDAIVEAAAELSAR
jgi:pyruvate dehydrogenase E1 component